MEDKIKAAIREIVREEVREALSKRDSLISKAAPLTPMHLYSVQSIAKIFDRSDDWVLDRIRQGVFPRVVDIGGKRASYRVKAADLQAYIDAHTVEMR